MRSWREDLEKELDSISTDTRLAVYNFGEIIELGKENCNDVERQGHGGGNIGKELICNLWK